MPNAKIFQTYFNQLLNWHPSGTQLPSPPKELSLLPGAIRQERHPTWSPSNSSLATSSPPMQLPSFRKVPPHSLQTLSVRIAATHSASMGCFEWLPMRIHSSPHCNGVQVSSPSLAEMLAQSVEIQASLRSKLKCGTCNASSSCKACTPNSAKWSSHCSYSLHRVSKELCPKLQVIIFHQCEASVLLGGNFKHLFPFKVYQDLHGPPKRPLLQGWPHQNISSIDGCCPMVILQSPSPLCSTQLFFFPAFWLCRKMIRSQTLGLHRVSYIQPNTLVNVNPTCKLDAQQNHQNS